jgi:hypothetical protein
MLEEDDGLLVRARKNLLQRRGVRYRSKMVFHWDDPSEDKVRLKGTSQILAYREEVGQTLRGRWWKTPFSSYLETVTMVVF